MKKPKGIESKGLDFYKLLYEDDEFCMELGRAILAAGRLEAELIRYLNSKNIGEKTKNANLGRIIIAAKKHKLLEKMIPVLETIKDQRNYLTHNIYALLSGLVEETILEGTNLLDSDISTYTERAWELKENLNGLADIVAKKNELG